MPSNKPRLAAYTTAEIVRKFDYISKYEKRSNSKQLEYVVEDYIRQFEEKHGQLILQDNGEVLPSINQIEQDKLSG